MISSCSISSSKHHLIEAKKRQSERKRAIQCFLFTRIDELQNRHPSIVRMEKGTRTHQKLRGRTKESFRTQEIPRIMFSCQMISSGSISSSKHHLIKAKKTTVRWKKGLSTLSCPKIDLSSTYISTHFPVVKDTKRQQAIEGKSKRRRSPKSEE